MTPQLALIEHKRGAWRAQFFKRRGRRVAPAGWIASTIFGDVADAVRATLRKDRP